MPALFTFGRILFAILFIYLGATKLFDVAATADAIATKLSIPDVLAPYVTQIESATAMTMPKLLALAAGVFEILAGLMIALNFGARFWSILLILYLAATTYYVYDFWNQAQPDNNKALIIDALKNLSLIGALFMIAGHGRGPRPVEVAYGDA